MYEPRTYRELFHGDELVFFNCVVKETDLQIGAHLPLAEQALAAVTGLRRQLEAYIAMVPQFRTTLVPLRAESWAPPVVRLMCEAAMAAGVGPMAAVAGAVSEFVGRELLAHSPEVIVENGGDIFLKTDRPRKIGIYAGQSPLSEKAALLVQPGQTPAGICTSAATVGPSLSFGNTDATVIVAENAALADAVASAVGNRVRTAADLQPALKLAEGIPGVRGAVVIIGDKLGAWGDVELVGF